jgi:hypothetical protein
MEVAEWDGCARGISMNSSKAPTGQLHHHYMRPTLGRTNVRARRRDKHTHRLIV